MQKLLLPLFFLFSTIAFAQTTVIWDGDTDGDGDGANWNDAMNWNGDVLPAATDTVIFNTSVTVGGTAVTGPLMVRFTNGAQVILALDLSIGDGTTESNGVELQAGCRFVAENGFTFTITPGGDGNGINLGSAATGASVNLKGSATVNITGGQHAVNLASDVDFTTRGALNISSVTGTGIRITAGTVTNKGDIIINGTAQNAIDNGASFINDNGSSVTIDGAGNNGIRNKDVGVFVNRKDITITNTTAATGDGISNQGTWTNEAGSTITVTEMNDDGIDVSAGSMANDGTINITNLSTASAGNGGLVVGTDAVAASFTNTSNNSLNINAGTGIDSRGILVMGMGDLSNTGTITLSGGDPDNRVNNEGTFTNDLGGTLDLTDGRANNSGTLTNDGLIVSSRLMGTSVFSTGTATNNGFFAYENSNNFAGGSGTNTDPGINLKQFSSRVIDGNGLTEVDIAEVPYTWTYNGASIGTADDSGLLMIDCSVIDNDTINIQPEGLNLPSPIRLRSVCVQQLPVELSRLEAISMPKSIMVKWATASEIANDYMAVERSADGVSFFEIGRVAGNGTSTIFNDYELEDNRPISGTNYYRLRQVDYDGTTVYSHIVNAEFGGAAAGAMKVYPTIVTSGELLTIDLSSVTSSKLRISDVNGRPLRLIPVTSGGTFRFPVNDLQAGMYFISDDSGTETVRFIIK